ncbi:MAG: Na/Pi cotransporter family protein, partial [Erysipelotrichaceae bacterium]
MSISNILMLVGGLALFLYGMHMMSEGLEVAAGNRMKAILEKLTSNRFVGVAVGAIITAIIQSSSATTVMVVGFVNSSLLQLEQAVWLIMGANIGTTITGQLIALDISKIAPLFAIIGVVMVSFIKKKKINYIGEIIAGLGILFIGMGMMSNAMIPLRDYQPFINLIANFSNPIIGILVGALFTAVIQSSSASVGILQALVMAGVLPFSSAIYVLFGQNIGTCITAVLASIGANRNAKRTTIIHLSFNIIGTVIFLFVVSFLPFTDWMMSITSNPAAQIANTHTVFNLVTTLALLPFGAYLAKLAKIILPLKPEESEDEDNFSLSYINENNIGSVAIALSTL